MGKLPAHVAWPGFVVGLLTMSLTFVTITVVAAVGDPSFAVHEDYYERAINWDRHVDQQRRNEALGWSVGLSLSPGEPTGVRLLLSDRAGAGLEGASIAGECFHQARAAEVRGMEFAPAGRPGLYEAPVLLDRPGRWRIRLRIEVGGEAFTDEQTLELVRGEGG